MKKKSNIFLFTGLLRHKKKLIKSLIQVKLLFLFDSIIISTWEDQLDDKMLLFFFKILNIQIISNKSKKDPYGLMGNFYYQMKSMEYGLNGIEDNAFVFKSRTDVHIKPSAIRKILKLDYELTEPSFFNYKIWIPYFEVTKIFYFGDECFYGNCEDLKKFTNYETIFDDIGMDAGTSHVRRFGFPYTNHDIKYLDLLKQYGNCHFGEERFLILEDRLKQKDYLKYLNSYYTLVKREFRIGLGNESNYITFRKWSSGEIFPQSDDIFESLTKKYACLEQGHIFSYDENWLKNLKTFV